VLLPLRSETAEAFQRVPCLDHVRSFVAMTIERVQACVTPLHVIQVEMCVVLQGSVKAGVGEYGQEDLGIRARSPHVCCEGLPETVGMNALLDSRPSLDTLADSPGILPVRPLTPEVGDVLPVAEEEGRIILSGGEMFLQDAGKHRVERDRDFLSALHFYCEFAPREVQILDLEPVELGPPSSVQ